MVHCYICCDSSSGCNNEANSYNSLFVEKNKTNKWFEKVGVMLYAYFTFDIVKEHVDNVRCKLCISNMSLTCIVMMM